MTELLSTGVSPGLIIGILVCIAAFTVFVIYAIIIGQRRRITAGIEEMIGTEAVAQMNLNPKGTVLAEGELWTAIAEDGEIRSGDDVVILKVEGLKLRVTRKSKEQAKEEK